MPWKEVPSTAHQVTNSDCFNSYASKTVMRETFSEEIALNTKDGMVKQYQLDKGKDQH
jgi:hypothetical protein